MLSWEILLMVESKPITRAEIKKLIGKNKEPKFKAITNKAILKKSPQGTVVFSREEPNSKYFKQEWEKARWV